MFKDTLRRLSPHLKHYEGGAPRSVSVAPDRLQNRENPNYLEEFFDSLSPDEREINISDERIEKLICGISQLDTPELDEPVTPDYFSQLPEAQRKIKLKPPENIEEGAEVSSYAVPIKIDAFISAPDITSWENGRDENGRDGFKNGNSSRSVIRKFSKKPPGDFSPIQNVIVYVNPQENKVYASLVGDGAHRLCGAKVRRKRVGRDEGIYCQDVTIRIL